MENKRNLRALLFGRDPVHAQALDQVEAGLAANTEITVERAGTYIAIMGTGDSFHAGLQCLAAIKEVHPEMKVVVLTDEHPRVPASVREIAFPIRAYSFHQMASYEPDFSHAPKASRAERGIRKEKRHQNKFVNHRLQNSCKR